MNYAEMKKIIESCHLNFLIGSGTSKPFLGTLGTIETMLTELSKESDSDQKTLIDASIKKHYFDVAIKGNLDILTSDCEDLTTTKNTYSIFINSINTILSKRKSNLVSKQVNIFTTNMDLFLEHTIEHSEISYNDGFYGKINPKYGTENFHNILKKTSLHYEYQSEIPLFNLFKLHGSLNWNEIDDKIYFDYNLRTLNEIDSIITDNKEPFLNLIKSDNKCKTIAELKEDKINLHQAHQDFLNSYNKLIMINPTKLKFETTTMDLTYYELLRMYSNHLERENSVLFVIGFSFEDEHIREITRRVAASNPTLLIVIFSFEEGAINDSIKESNNIKILIPEKDEQKLSLSEINTQYFQKMAQELNGSNNE